MQQGFLSCGTQLMELPATRTSVASHSGAVPWIQLSKSDRPALRPAPSLQEAAAQRSPHFFRCAPCPACLSSCRQQEGRGGADGCPPLKVRDRLQIILSSQAGELSKLEGEQSQPRSKPVCMSSDQCMAIGAAPAGTSPIPPPIPGKGHLNGVLPFKMQHLQPKTLQEPPRVAELGVGGEQQDGISQMNGP